MAFVAMTNLLIGLAAAPLLFGVINRTKALFAGRRGSPLLQLYFDIWKLLHKGATYSRTTTWVFRAGPVVGLAAVLVAMAIVPLGGRPGLVAFPGDFVLLAYLLGIMRFFTVAAALDTGSSFEGMGASREVQFSAFAEPALLLGLAALCRVTGDLSLSGLLSGVGMTKGLHLFPVLALVSVAFMIVLLAENSRIPVDDPNTHLELTMIHEVMVLDHGGPDLAFVLYGSALKLWVLGAICLGVILPVRTGSALADTLVALAGMLGLSVVVGVIESSMARLRLLHVPHLLVGATVFSGLAFLLILSSPR
jgi:formate hydrogenlyase subunit 4